MDWSAMFSARVVVLGCGNTLFGDDGLAPRTVSHLAEEATATGQFFDVAFVDAGTSGRTLLTDLALSPPAALQRLIVVDVVQEPEREAGSITVEYTQAAADRQVAGRQVLSTVGNPMLHQAPTKALLCRLHAAMGIELIMVTVQAACIPTLMDDSLSASARAAFPLLQKTLRELCRAGTGHPQSAGFQSEPAREHA